MAKDFWDGASYLGQKAWGGLVGSIEGIWDFTAGGIADLAGNIGIDGADEWAEKQIKNDWMDYEEADRWFQPTGGWKFAGDVAAGIGNSIPSLAATIGLAFATGGTSLAVQAGTTFGISFLSAGGNAVKEAYNETGKLTGKEWGYGAMSGALEGIVESADTIFGLGKGAVLKAFGKTAAKSAARTSFGRVVIDGFIGEAGEEFISAALSSYIKRATYDENAENATLGEITYSSLVSGVSGMLMGGGGAGVRSGADLISGARNAHSEEKSSRIINAAKAIHDYEREANTENEVFLEVADGYEKLEEGLKKNGGSYTVSEMKQLGYLNERIGAALLQPKFMQSAYAVLADPEATVESINKFYGDDKLTVEELTKGIDRGKKGRDFQNSVYKAMKSNSRLRELVAIQVVGSMELDSRNYAEAIFGDTPISTVATQENINRFVSGKDEATVAAVSSALGIDMRTARADELAGAIARARDSGGLEQYREGVEAIRAAREVSESSGEPSVNVTTAAEGATRYTVGGRDIAIVRNGSAYRIYDYASENITKSLTAAEAMKYVSAMKRASVANTEAVGVVSTRENAENAQRSENSGALGDVSPDRRSSLSPTKANRLASEIIKLGERGLRVFINGEKVILRTDDFTVNKALYSSKGRTSGEVNARIKNIPDFDKIIAASKYTRTETTIKNIEKDAKKGVSAIHHLEGKYGEYDIDVVIRQKGKRYFLYEVKFIDKKKSSQQSMIDNGNADLHGSANGDVENDVIVAQRKSKSNTSDKKTSEKSEKTTETPAEKAKAAAVRLFCKEKIPEYVKLTHSEREAVEMTVRQARALGMSDADAAILGRVAAKSGMNIYVLENIPGENAFYNGGNGVYVNAKAERSKIYSGLMGHESFHKLFATEKGARKLFNKAVSRVDAKTKKELKERYGKALKKAGYNEIDRGRIIAEEYAAAYSEEIFNHEGVWEYILSEDPSIKDRVTRFFSGAARRYSFEQKISAEARKWLAKYKKLFNSLSEKNSGTAARVNANERYDVRTTDDSNEAKTDENKDLTTTNEQKTQDSGKRSALFSFGVTQEDIDKYVNDSYNKENTEDYKPYADVDKRLLNAVSQEIDITGYVHALRDNDIRHIRNSHGEETNEKYPVTKKDLSMIPYIVTNYDKVFVKQNARGEPGLVYVKVGEDNVIYYVEAVTTQYHNQKLLVNKQMVKAGIDYIPKLNGLEKAITKKESESQYLADLKKIRKAYVQDVKEKHSTTSIPENSEKSNPSGEKNSEKFSGAVDTGRRSSFAGENSKTANKNRLRIAERMLEEGVDPETIRQKSGWYKGYDGLWRYEIDDSKMKFEPKGYEVPSEQVEYEILEAKKRGGELTVKERMRLEELQPEYEWRRTYLSDFVKHDELFEAYPELGDIRVKYVHSRTDDGQYSVKENTLYLNHAATKKRLQTVIVHELQHAVQFIEGFAEGSDPGMFEGVALPKEYREFYDKFRTLEKTMSDYLKEEGYDAYDFSKLDKDYGYLSNYVDEHIGIIEKLAESDVRIKRELNEYKQLRDVFREYRRNTPYGMYFRTAGEIEARDAAARRKMTAKQRTETRPDVDQKNVILVGGMKGDRVQVFETLNRRSDGEYSEVDTSSKKVYNEFEKNKEDVPVYETEKRQTEPTDFKLLRQNWKAADEKYGLSEKESSTLEAYVRGIAYIANQRLLDGNISDSDAKYIQFIIEAAKKFPVYEGRTYRNLRFKDEQSYNTFLEENLQDDVVELKALTSTSKRPNGYPLFGKYVVHMVLDGVSGRDIADTYGIPKQQEVLFLPGARYTVNSVSVANDGHPIIFVKEIANNEVQIGEGNNEGRELESARNRENNRELSQREGNDSGRVLFRDGRGTEVNGRGSRREIHGADHLKSEPKSYEKPKDTGRRSSIYRGTTTDEGEMWERRANKESDKVYYRDDVEKVFESTGFFGNLTEEERADIVDNVWVEMNARFSDGQRQRSIEVMGNHIYATALQSDAGYYDEASREEIAGMKREIFDTLRYVNKKVGVESLKVKTERSGVDKAVLDSLIAEQEKERARIKKNTDKRFEEYREKQEARAEKEKEYNKKVLENTREQNDERFERMKARHRAEVRGIKAAARAQVRNNKIFNKAEVYRALTEIEEVGKLPKARVRELADELCEALNTVRNSEELSKRIEKLTNDLTVDIVRVAGDDLLGTDPDKLATVGDLSDKVMNTIDKLYAEGGRKTLRARYDEKEKRFKGFVKDVKESNKERDARDAAREELNMTAMSIRNKKFGTVFDNAAEYKGNTLKGLLKELSAFEYRRTFSRNAVREKVRELSEWYSEENPMLSYENEEYPGCFVRSIKERLEALSEGEKALSAEELRTLNDVLRYFVKFVYTYNKVLMDGKWVDGAESASAFVENNEQSKKTMRGWGQVYRTRYVVPFGTPETVMRAADGFGDGFFSTMYYQLREADVQANIDIMNVMREAEDFVSKHRKYVGKLNKKKYDVRGVSLTKLELIEYYMSLGRTDALEALGENGFIVKNKKGTDVRVSGFAPGASLAELEMLAERERSSIKEKLNKNDLKLIGIFERGYEATKKIKSEADIERLGFPNVIDGYYYPTKRSYVGTKTIDAGLEASFVDRFTYASFNKHTKEHAAQPLVIGSAWDTFESHVRGIAYYSRVSPVIETYNRLWKLNLNADKNNPRSIETVMSQDDATWRIKGQIVGHKYFSDMVYNLMNGSKAKDAVGSKALGWIRGRAATFSLGFNPKVWVTQFSSAIAAFSKLGGWSLARGIFSVSSKDVYKYCPLAELRRKDNAVVMAQSVVDKIGKFGDLFTKPISWFDSIVVKRLFAAAQVETARHGGPKIGTEENKIKAGKLLHKVILETQQNTFQTSKTDAARNGGESAKMIMMFKSDAVQTQGNVITAFGNHRSLRIRLKDKSLSTEERARLKKELKTAGNNCFKAVGALLLSCAYMILVDEGFKWLYNKDDNEKENKFWGIASTLLGGLPIFGDIADYFANGFELETMELSVINELLNGATEIYDYSDKVMSGEATDKDGAKLIKDLIFTAGQLTGIPTRNVYNSVYGLIKRVSEPTAYKIDEIFKNQTYSSDFKDASKEEKEALAETILATAYEENVGIGLEEKSVKELTRLGGLDYDVIPSAVGNKITVNKEEITLTAEDREEIAAVYSLAVPKINELIDSAVYENIDDEAKAKKINSLLKKYRDLGYDRIRKRYGATDSSSSRKISIKIPEVKREKRKSLLSGESSSADKASGRGGKTRGSLLSGYSKALFG